jgi:hypothetical protein
MALRRRTVALQLDNLRGKDGQGRQAVRTDRGTTMKLLRRRRSTHRREGRRRRLRERPLRRPKGKKAARRLVMTYAGREEEVSGDLRPAARDQR